MKYLVFLIVLTILLTGCPSKEVKIYPDEVQYILYNPTYEMLRDLVYFIEDKYKGDAGITINSINDITVIIKGSNKKGFDDIDYGIWNEE